MKTLEATALTAATLATATLANAAAGGDVNELVNCIRSKDDKVRGEAWQNAGGYGAAAVEPLAGLLTDADFEVARSAKRALYKIIHHAGRPGAAREAKAVEAKLVPLLKHDSAAVRRELIWMLSEIGGDPSVEPLAKLLLDTEVRDDARMALQRLPTAQATPTLRKALKEVPEDFRPNVAEALRKRGEKIAEYPSQKLTPTK